MGASASVEKTQLQKDIEYLGDRMPFGDAELLQVYRVYQKLQQKFREGDVNSSSFLKDVGALSASEGLKPKKRQEIRGVLRISEEMGGKIHLKYMSEAIKYPLIISVFVKTWLILVFEKYMIQIKCKYKKSEEINPKFGGNQRDHSTFL